jgi:hypothetical protein
MSTTFEMLCDDDGGPGHACSRMAIARIQAADDGQGRDSMSGGSCCSGGMDGQGGLHHPHAMLWGLKGHGSKRTREMEPVAPMTHGRRKPHGQRNAGLDTPLFLLALCQMPSEEAKPSPAIQLADWTYEPRARFTRFFYNVPTPLVVQLCAGGRQHRPSPRRTKPKSLAHISLISHALNLQPEQHHRYLASVIRRPVTL